MLDFFRRYERYFFFVITFVVIISFSFFGTYSTLSSNSWKEQIAFKAVNGQEVTRSDLDEMVQFLATDNDDKMLFGGMWGPNFLNDGVIRKDFLETGLAQQLAFAYADDLQEDIQKRLLKEKKFSLYRHPQATFLSVESIWHYLAPEMNVHFDSLRMAQNGLDEDAFNSRVKLYIGEKRLPASALKYLLTYQEKQYGWLKHDEMLNRADLSLFGYHTIEDWFGPNLTRLVAQFVINAAILAEEQGYTVSKAEVLADLISRTKKSYQENLKSPYLGVTSPEEYFSEQLRRLNIDQAQAIKIWRQVLLFRRYFHDASGVALVDTLFGKQMQQFADGNVTLDVYRLPASLKLATNDDLQKFELYLQAVSKKNQTDPLALPQQFLSVEEVAKATPELVQKKYELEVAKVTHKTLQARIGLRELWNWEVEETNWKSLVKQFSTLGAKSGKTRDQRLEILDNLDATIRSNVDTYAKQMIVKAHQEWMTQALNDAKKEKMVVGLRAQGGKMPFSGMEQKEKRKKFIGLLDDALLGDTIAENSPLFHYTADDQTYYRIAVLNRAPAKEILTFAEARSDGTLDELLTRTLKKEPSGNKGIENVLLAIEPLQKQLAPDENKEFWSKDQAASLRFYTYLNTIKETLENDPTKATTWLATAGEDKNQSLSSLADQWKIEKKTMTISRQKSEDFLDNAEVFSLKVDEWSSINTPLNGDLVFYQVKEVGIAPLKHSTLAQQTMKAQSLLGAEAQRHLMQKILKELQSQNAISLAYLRLPADEMVPEQETMD